MKYFLLFISLISITHTQKFSEESPYLMVRLMDLKLHEWKPIMLKRLEDVVDAELKRTDEKKGVACKSIKFEQELRYPKVHERFLDLSIRGICTDEKNKEQDIPKDLIINAIKRRKDEVQAVAKAIVFSIGHEQLYARDRNKLNLIIIPVSISFVVFLFVLTFFLRRMRITQKRIHIISELQRKKESSAKKAQTLPNIDPHANDKQRLLQLDPTVVGSVSDTMGNPKEFSYEQHTTPTRNNTVNTVDHRFPNREYQGVQPPIPSKENRAPYHNREDDTTFQAQRSLKSSRERMHVPYENESRFSTTHSQYPEMVPLHEQHPRVVVRQVRDDGNYPAYQQQLYEESAKTFVSIPVQIEHSGSHQRFVPPPYHSDPYYPNVNS